MDKMYHRGGRGALAILVLTSAILLAMARRKGLQIILSALLGINATLVEARADVILDTLGSATTTTTFSVLVAADK